MNTKVDKLRIEKGDDKTIEDGGFELDIKPYTVLIGENNSGKTNLVKAFQDQHSKEYNFIYFPATNVEVEKSNEVSTSKKTSPFYKLLAEILKSEKLDLGESLTKPINAKLAEISNKINKDISFVNNKETILRLVDTLSEEAIIKNLIPLRMIDRYWKGGKEVNLGDVGQGTQRIIIFALLKYYSEQDSKNSKLNFFIIEEPEICLHPRLKLEFNKVLSEISNKENNQVLITTHDPYFVEMNTDERDNKCIVAIQRNQKTGFTEEVSIKPEILPGVSHGEINYRIFGVCSNSFHNELYGHLQENTKNFTTDELDTYFIDNGLAKSKKWNKEEKGVPQGEKPVTLQTFIRNKIHHPENKTMKTSIFSPDELEQSIEEMARIT